MCYLMLIGDFGVATGRQLLNHEISRRYVIMLVAVFFILPLAVLRKVKSLWFTGFMVMAFVAFFVLAVLYSVAADTSPAVPHAAVRTTLLDFFRGLPLAV